ncbi:MAG: hypothetical protein RBU37_06135, partial [Myxococcota bacterium]|nr:hypothetical protein [Myxococcota bacterium]
DLVWQYLSEVGCVSAIALWSAGAMVLDGEPLLRLEASYEWTPEVVDYEEELPSEEEVLATAPSAELVEGTAELAGRVLRFRLGPSGVELERKGSFEPLVLLPDVMDAETVTPELCGTYYQSSVEFFDGSATLAPLLSGLPQGPAAFYVHLTIWRSLSAGGVECMMPNSNTLEYDRWVRVELDTDELIELWIRERYEAAADGGGGSWRTMDESIEAHFALPTGELSYSESSGSTHEAGWNYVEESLETEDPEVDFYDEETTSLSWSWVFSAADGVVWTLAEDSRESTGEEECY